MSFNSVKTKNTNYKINFQKCEGGGPTGWQQQVDNVLHLSGASPLSSPPLSRALNSCQQRSSDKWDI